MRRDVRTEILDEVVEPLFRELPPLDVSGVAPVVLQNRTRRAKEWLADALAVRGTAEVPEALHAEVRDLLRRGREAQFGERVLLDIAGLEERLAGEGLDEATAHRQWLRATYGSVELKGLQTSARVFQDLDRLWVPLRLTGRLELPLGEGTELLPLGRPLTVEQALAEHRRLLVVGAPGSGKSTLVQWLATREEEPGPVFVVPVRRLRALPDVDAVARLNERSPAFVARGLDEGALVLLDGLDEGALAGQQLLDTIAAFAAAHPAARFVATTRPSALEDRCAPAGFEPVDLAALDAEQVDDLVGRWFLAAELSLATAGRRAAAEARATKAAADLKRRLRRSPAVAELARTPLVASVVCVVHRFLGEKLPERRAALYEACTNVLLHEWDRSKFDDDALVGRLDAPQKRLLLGALALRMHEAGKVEVPEAEVVEVFGARLPDLGVDAGDAPGIVREIRDRSGVLVEREPGVFAFSHLSFQEYLAAVEVVRAGDVEGLARRVADRRWHEVILFAAGLPHGKVDALVDGLLAVGTSAGVVLAARCLEAAVAAPVALRGRVREALDGVVPPSGMNAALSLARVGPQIVPLLEPHVFGPDRGVSLWSAVSLAGGGGDAAIELLSAYFERHGSRTIPLDGPTSLVATMVVLNPFLERIMHSPAFADVASRLKSSIPRAAVATPYRSFMDALPGEWPLDSPPSTPPPSR